MLMIANTQLWQLGLDFGLLGSLILLCYRFARSGRAARQLSNLDALERKLATAIKEAEESLRLIGDQVNKRQQSFEKLVFDVGTVESRINRSITSAEEIRGKMESDITRAKQAATQLSQELTAAPTKPLTLSQAVTQTVVEPAAAPQFMPQHGARTPQHADRTAQHAAHPPQHPAHTPQEIFSPTPTRASEELVRPLPVRMVPEPPSFDSAVFDSAERPSRATPYEKWVDYNIYGEPLNAESRRGPLRNNARRVAERVYQPLSASVEKTIVPSLPVQPAAETQSETPAKPSVEEQEITRNIERIYDYAEELLRAGRDLQSVARETALPVSEIEMISRMIVSESAALPSAGEEQLTVRSDDARLGVLGNVRRQPETV